MDQTTRRRANPLWLSLAVLCAGQMMIVIDQNIVNVALPTIQRSLHFSPANLVWVVNAYVIPFGGLLLLAGRLGDLVGRRAVFISGIVLFSGASLLCGFATSEATLIVFRFIQGVGGAIASACILGMVATMYSESRKRAQAIAAYSFAAAGGGAVGPVLGGVLTNFASWNWIFFVNVPIGAVVVIFGLRAIDKDVGLGLGRGADFLGALLATSGLILFVYTLVNVEAAGWGSVQTLTLGPLSVLLLIGFLIREATAKQPLLPLKIFRSRSVSAANIIQFLMIAGMFGLLYFGTLYIQRVLGFTPLQAGLGFVPIAVVIAAVALGLSARVIMWYGPRPVLFLGLALIIAAFVLLQFSRVNGTYLVDFLPGTLLMGLGFGLAAPAVIGLGMAAVKPGESGIASGLFNTTQQVGGAIGLAVLDVFVTSRTNSLTASGHSQAASLLGGYHLGFLLAAVFVAASLIVAASMLRKPPRTGRGRADGARRTGSRSLLTVIS
jgi:EmrB/QacA subfamily drug resistance transporter